MGCHVWDNPPPYKHSFILKMRETQLSYGLLHFKPRSILNMISTAAIERDHQKDILVDVVQQMSGYLGHGGASQQTGFTGRWT